MVTDGVKAETRGTGIVIPLGKSLEPTATDNGDKIGRIGKMTDNMW